MAGFSRRDYSDRNSGGRGSRRDRGSRDVTMHTVTCDECGKSCQVPFKPTGDKPVYCSDCFERRGGGSSDRGDNRGDRGDRGGRRNSSGRGDRYGSNDREMYHAVCDACGADCEVPFRPSGDKPVYCSQCFEDRGNGRDNNRGGGNDYNQRSRNQSNRDFGSDNSNNNEDLLNTINEKLDQILQMVDKKKVIRVKKKKQEVTEDLPSEEKVEETKGKIEDLTSDLDEAITPENLLED